MSMQYIINFRIIMGEINLMYTLGRNHGLDNKYISLKQPADYQLGRQHCCQYGMSVGVEVRSNQFDIAC